MLLPVDNTTRIKGTRYSWDIQHLHKNIDKETDEDKSYWLAETYHSTLEGAINELIQRRIRTSEVESVGEALKEIERIKFEVSTALSPHYKLVAGESYDQ